MDDRQNLMSNTGESTVMDQKRCLIPVSTNAITHSVENVVSPGTDICLEKFETCNELNSKNTFSVSKKGKTGVDSLLEKLENCNRKLVRLEVGGSQNMNDRDLISIDSFLPEYCHSKSPNNQDEYSIASICGNDEVNDFKQRRKRKLGKPIRLTKDVKLENEIMNNETEKLKSADCAQTTKNTECERSSLRCKSSTSKNQIKMENYSDSSSIQSLKSEQYRNSIVKSSEIKSTSETVSRYHKNNLYSQESVEGEITETYNNSHKYVINSKTAHQFRGRSYSECLIQPSAKIRAKRTKSYDDMDGLTHSSVPKMFMINTVAAFNEVESQLEKMFAGIVETDKELIKKTISSSEKSFSFLSKDEPKDNLIKNDDICNSSRDFTLNMQFDENESKIKNKNILRSRPYRKKSNSLCDFASNTTIQIPKKEKKKYLDLKLPSKLIFKNNNGKNARIKNPRRSCDSSMNIAPMRSRGPVVQIRGSKIDLGYVRVVNISREDDEERNKEKRKAFGNGFQGRSKKMIYQNISEYRGKSMNTGLFNSTLCMRYDSCSADTTWICVFCKRGPHYIIPGYSTQFFSDVSGTTMISDPDLIHIGVLSDLFGPYVIERDCSNINFIRMDEQNLSKERKLEKAMKYCSRFTEITDQLVMVSNKRKKKHSVCASNLTGITMLNGEERWEVWLHEECIMWTNNVHVTGGRIRGLQEAVWDSMHSICESCGLSGANIGCTNRGCKSVIHYCCALTAGWLLDTEYFRPECNMHKQG